LPPELRFSSRYMIQIFPNKLAMHLSQIALDI